MWVRFIIILLFAGGWGLSIFQCSRNSKVISEVEANITAITDTVRQYRDREGNHVAMVHLLQSANANYVMKLNLQDSTEKQLQHRISELKRQVSRLQSVTSHTDIVRIDTVLNTVTRIDTLNNGITEFNAVTPWYRLYGVLKDTTVDLSLSVTNRYDVAIIREKKGFAVEVTSLNPYTVNQTVRGWTTPYPRQKRFGIGIHAGYGYSNKGFVPYIGIGLNYNVIVF